MEDECCICLEALENGEVFDLRCQHKIHKHCFLELIKTNINKEFIACPICRTPHQMIIVYDEHTQSTRQNNINKYNNYVIPSLLTTWIFVLGYLLYEAN